VFAESSRETPLRDAGRQVIWLLRPGETGTRES
jgi:hypothetical protein